MTMVKEAKEKVYKSTFLEDPNANYKSFEQIAIDKLEGSREFVKGALEGVYGTCSSIFRVPTLIRKSTLKQDLVSKMSTDNIPRMVGIALGGTGTVANFIYHRLVHSDIGEEIILDGTTFQEFGYVPLLVVAATNIASGIYEFGRRDQTRKEKKRFSEY